MSTKPSWGLLTYALMAGLLGAAVVTGLTLLGNAADPGVIVQQDPS